MIFITINKATVWLPTMYNEKVILSWTIDYTRETREGGEQESFTFINSGFHCHLVDKPICTFELIYIGPLLERMAQWIYRRK